MVSFASAERSLSVQSATAYIVYMMGGSYFKYCECGSHIFNEQLYLHYRSVKKETQYKVEEQIDRMLAEFLDKPSVAQCTCTAKYAKDLKTGMMYITFIVDKPHPLDVNDKYILAINQSGRVQFV